MTSSQPRIAVIGAGPAGLTLGLLLLKNDVPFTIFELRPQTTDEEFARPSGSLDLHEESGLASIKECGLYDELLPLTGECFEDDIIADKNGNILHADQGEQSNRPEISRHALIKLLLSRVPSDRIRWEHKLASATTSTTTSGDARTELDFGAKGKHSFDLVIGADGAWSRVRKLLTPIKPHYSGVHVVTATIRQIARKHSDLAQLVGRGTFMALGMGHGVCSQRGGQDTARIYVFISTPDEHFAKSTGLSDLTSTEAKDKLVTNETLLGTWAPILKELTAVACDSETAANPGAYIDIKPLYTLPVENSWTHNPGVTIIGDAAHLMCPWAGEGVNLAMWDALLLSRAIVKAFVESNQGTASFQKTLSPLMKEFQTDMTARTREKAEMTAANGQMMFAEDGAKAMAALFSGQGPPA